jgi:hypothetical protein
MLVQIGRKAVTLSAAVARRRTFDVAKKDLTPFRCYGALISRQVFWTTPAEPYEYRRLSP